MICHKKSILQVSVKLNITYNSFHELICNYDGKLIATMIKGKLEGHAATTR